MKGDVLKHVSILDLLVVNVFRGMPSKEDPYPLAISIDPLEQTKRFVIDESAQKVLNQKLTEKLQGSDPRNPNTIEYAKEFVSKMLEELHRSGLCLIEDMPEASEDPYDFVRKKYKNGR
jgi:hypothetical protein